MRVIEVWSDGRPPVWRIWDEATAAFKVGRREPTSHRIRGLRWFQKTVIDEKSKMKRGELRVVSNSFMKKFFKKRGSELKHRFERCLSTEPVERAPLRQGEGEEPRAGRFRRPSRGSPPHLAPPPRVFFFIAGSQQKKKRRKILSTNQTTKQEVMG